MDSIEQRDKRALCALQQQCSTAPIQPKQSYYISGERHIGPSMRYYHRWLHELKKQ